MKKVKVSVTIASDEKDFSAVLDIITTHRSRALMSVNVESLLTYSSDHFLAILAKYGRGDRLASASGKLLLKA